MVKPLEQIVAIAHEAHIDLARIESRARSQNALRAVKIHRIVNSIAELAPDVHIFAGERTIKSQVLARDADGDGLEGVVCDEGPGTGDIELALADEQSITSGLGGGLPGVKRLMSEIEITSVAGRGTVVREAKRLSESAVSEDSHHGPGWGIRPRAAGEF